MDIVSPFNIFLGETSNQEERQFVALKLQA